MHSKSIAKYQIYICYIIVDLKFTYTPLFYNVLRKISTIIFSYNSVLLVHYMKREASSVNRRFYKIISFIIIVVFLFVNLTISSTYAIKIPDNDAEARKALPIQSNDIQGWPTAPAIEAQSAILMDADTGAILYSKNIHSKLYPASITKILTTYIASKSVPLSDTVVMSEDAISSIVWWNDANIGIRAGEALSMKDALYAVMTNSANEVAYAVAEHVSGNVDDFVKLMNKTAKDIGCLNTNFTSPNGLHDENHYTTAYDMAIMAKEYFKSDFNRTISSTSNYDISVIDAIDNDTIQLRSRNLLLEGQKYHYEYLVGSKTGYTDIANNTLVSCARKDGMTLICVVMMEDDFMQFEDTLTLFNYGFTHFSRTAINGENSNFSLDGDSIFSKINNNSANSSSLFRVNDDAYVTLPNDVSTSAIDSKIIFDSSLKIDDGFAAVEHSYNGAIIGTSYILSNHANVDPSSEGGIHTTIMKEYFFTKSGSTLVINISHFLYAILAVFVFMLIIKGFFYILNTYNVLNNFNRKIKRRRNRKNGF